jgi:serine protease Do
MEQQPAPAWIPPAHHLPVSEPRGRSKTWRAAAIIVVAVLFAVCGAGLAVQQSRLNSTRSDLAAVKASVNAQGAQLSTLNASATTQQQSLASLSAQLSTAKTELGSTQTQLQTAQSGLRSAQTRLQADEKQLNITTSDLPPDLTTLAAKVSPSIVLVSCDAPGGGVGTGFALAIPIAPGYTTAIVTAEHVIDACTDMSTGSVLSVVIGTQEVAAHLRSFDTTDDVAILDTTVHLPALQPSGAPVVGEFLMAIGHPLGNIQVNVTQGIVSDVYDTEFLDTAPISNGNSGGPVVDRNGQVVGIVDLGGAGTPDVPVVENYNTSLRLSRLCLQLLNGPTCDALH